MVEGSGAVDSSFRDVVELRDCSIYVARGVSDLDLDGGGRWLYVAKFVTVRFRIGI